MIPGRKGILVALAFVLIFSMVMFGCARTQEKELDVVTAEPAEQAPPAEPTVVDVKPEPAPAMQEPAPTILGTPDFDVSMMTDIFFAYDKSDLTMESRNRLSSNAKLLKAWKNPSIIIEGHCDERGTNEYNLGLGERRANAVKSYLVSLGVDAAKIKTISYGEERPFARGHSEDAWKMNRRAHFTLP